MMFSTVRGREVRVSWRPGRCAEAKAWVREAAGREAQQAPGLFSGACDFLLTVARGRRYHGGGGADCGVACYAMRTQERDEEWADLPLHKRVSERGPP